MSQPRRYAHDQLATAVAASHSWRGVLRALGRPAHSAGALRSVRQQADAFGIDHSHFTGQRRWSDRQLIDAVAASVSWREVLERLGLDETGGDVRALRGHATRLGIDVSHLARRPAVATRPPEPQSNHLRTAGPTLAAAWFMLRGFQVLWPLEPCRYDLAVRREGKFERIQVKTATYRSNERFVAQLSNSRRPGRRAVYDVDEIDAFFVIDAELNAYLIPFAAVAGFGQISLRSYRSYLVGERGNWLVNPTP